MILIVGQNLAWQKVCRVAGLRRGEVNRVSDMSVFASSKGPNVARALIALGGVGEVIGYAGGATGGMVSEYLRAEGLPCTLIGIEAETRTCMTYVEPDGACTEMIEPSPVVTVAERDRLSAAFTERIAEARVLVISGTAAAGEDQDCYVRFVSAAHERGIPVLLDSSSREARRALTASPEVLKINSHELGEIAGFPVESQEQRLAACRQIMDRYGVRWCFVSRGAAGIEGFNGRKVLHGVPPSVTVVNAIGSGDAAAAGASWVIHERLASLSRDALFSDDAVFPETLLVATAMGTANCLTTVTGNVDPDEYRNVKARTRILPLPA
jgi:tagatose 6-phosphate kinase